MTEHRAPTPAGADRAAADAERLYAQLFDANPFPAVVSRLDDQTVLAINARTAEIVGVPPEEAIGQTVGSYYVEPGDRAQLTERLRRDGRVDDLRLRIRRANGEPIWVLASFRLITWKTIPAVFAVFHDISEQLAAEASLKASGRRLVAQSDALTSLTARYTNPSERFDARLRSILEFAARALQVERLSMWRFDEGREAIVCGGLFRVADEGYESGGVIRRQDAPAYFTALERDRVVAAGDARTDPRTREFLETYLEPQGIGAMLDVPLRHDNATIGVLCAEHVGGPRAWEVDEQNFAIAVGNLIVVALAEEERRDALVRLAESEARARMIVDTAHDAFIGIDSEGRIAAWNAQAEATFGWLRQEVLGRNLAEIIIPVAFRDAHTNGMRRFHETGHAPVVNQRLELTALHRSGREFPIELTITSPMDLARGGFFFGAFLRDISDRRERDAELRRAKEAAEAATRAKSEFLANMSHELRTPLNGVLGYSQLLQRDRTLRATQREALEAISKCGSQLLDLINDVLDLSKIEAGRLDIEAAPTDLSRLMTDLRYVVAEAAERKGLRLTMTVAADVPRSVVLDGRHLRQALLNLLGNAVKFTEAGEVRLAITRENGLLGFEVSDTGVGIEPEALTEIFEAFSQTKTGAAAGGTGLGLTICNHLVTRMGGELKVQSERGAGSRFWFALPLVAAQKAPRIAGHDTDTGIPALDARLAPGERLTVLVVDDSTANRRILASLLESAGADVITAAGGLEAIGLARTHRPDVVFMDLKMSDLDGLEATRRLRRDPATAAIPVIAVTASAFGDVRQTARDAGCVDYLSKPIRAELLFGLLQTHLGVRFVSGGDHHPGGAAAGPAEVTHRVELAARIRSALALGDIGEIQAIGRQLAEGDSGDAPLGERIARLAAAFDFEALGELADALSPGPPV